jgi:hypothetical protein
LSISHRAPIARDKSVAPHEREGKGRDTEPIAEIRIETCRFALWAALLRHAQVLGRGNLATFEEF